MGFQQKILNNKVIIDPDLQKIESKVQEILKLDPDYEKKQEALEKKVEQQKKKRIAKRKANKKKLQQPQIIPKGTPTKELETIPRKKIHRRTASGGGVKKKLIF